MGIGGDTIIPLPPHVGAEPPLPLGPKSSRGEGSSPLSRSPLRHALPPLPLKTLGRSISNPVISTTRPHPQQRGGAGGAGGAAGLHGRGPLRKGKWTPEEELYAHYIIDNFNKGLIGLSRGTTLRSYLSDKLNWCVGACLLGWLVCLFGVLVWCACFVWFVVVGSKDRRT